MGEGESIPDTISTFLSSCQEEPGALLDSGHKREKVCPQHLPSTETHSTRVHRTTTQ